MTTLKKFTLIFSMLLIGASAGADSCKLCPQINALLKKMAHVAPDPLNSETVDKQEQLWGEALDIAKTAFKDKNWSKETAHAVVKLIVKTVPYDNSLTFEQETMREFQRLYKSPNSILKSTLDDLQKRGEISSSERQTTLEMFGIIPSHG